MRPAAQRRRHKSGDTYSSFLKSPGKCVYVGAYRTRDQAITAAAHFRDTGERLTDGRSIKRGGENRTRKVGRYVRKGARKDGSIFYEARYRTEAGKMVHVGRSDTEAGAWELIGNYERTLKPGSSTAYRRSFKRSWIVERVIDSGTRYIVRGRSPLGTQVHVATCYTHAEAIEAKRRYDETGETFKCVQAPRRKVAAKPSENKIPARKSQDTPTNPRERQPNESRTDWMKRLFAGSQN